MRSINSNDIISAVIHRLNSGDRGEVALDADSSTSVAAAAAVVCYWTVRIPTKPKHTVSNKGNNHVGRRDIDVGAPCYLGGLQLKAD